MPRETISGIGYDVKVGWDRDGSVQVATEMPTSETGPQDLHGLLATFGVGDHPRGLYATLSRAGVNDLIRTLRRARDQAFGRDE